MGDPERSDEDYRSLAQGYGARAKRYLARMVAKRKRLPLEATLLAAIPSVVTALPGFKSGFSVLNAAALVVGIAGTFLLKRSELQGGAKKGCEVLRELLTELEAVPVSGALTTWHRQVIDEAPLVLKGLEES